MKEQAKTFFESKNEKKPVAAADVNKLVKTFAGDNNLPEPSDDEIKGHVKDAKEFDAAGFSNLVAALLTEANKKKEEEDKKAELAKKEEKKEEAKPADNKTPGNTTAPAADNKATTAAK